MANHSFCGMLQIYNFLFLISGHVTDWAERRYWIRKKHYCYGARKNGLSCFLLGSSGQKTLRRTPRAPKAIGGTYTSKDPLNPATIATSVTNVPSGSKVIYCDVNGLNCANTAPALPTKPGIYVWCVKSMDTITNLTPVNNVVVFTQKRMDTTTIFFRNHLFNYLFFINLCKDRFRTRSNSLGRCIC